MQRGQLLNHRYRLTEVIGRGSTSVVWQAHDELLNRTVAVKVVSPHRTADGVVRSHMLADAQAAATLTHPNLVAIHDYGETPGKYGEALPFVVMELLTGRSLADPTVINSLAPREAINVCAQVASALAALHEHGIVHRAIRPSNIVLTPAGAKVVDFGVAALTDPPEVDQYGQPLTTPAYLAPERMLGGEASAAADVYALGVLIYRLLTHEPPWPTHTSADNVRARLMGAEPKPMPPLDGVPTQVHDLYRRCLDQNPARRPAAADVASILEPATHAATADDDIARFRAERRTITTAEAARAGRRRRKAVAKLASTIGLAAAAIALVTFTLAQLQDPGSGARASNPYATQYRTPTGSATNSAEPGTRQPPPVTTDPGPPTITTLQEPVTTTTAPIIETLTSVGGTVTVLCQGVLANVKSVDPAAGFTATTQTVGASDQVRVVLASSTHESNIRARCGTQGLVPTVKETALGANPQTGTRPGR